MAGVARVADVEALAACAAAFVNGGRTAPEPPQSLMNVSRRASEFPRDPGSSSTWARLCGFW